MVLMLVAQCVLDPHGRDSLACWLYAFGTPYVLQCYMALKRVRRRKLLETPWVVVVVEVL